MTLIAVAVLSNFGAALAAPMICRLLKTATGWVLALLPLSLTLFFAGLLSQAKEGSPAFYIYEWVPQLGINLSFRADGLSLLFALLISGIGMLVIIYAGGYMKGHAQLGRFYAWLMTFMGSMLGVALADNLILLFIFWELTSLSSYMLIGFDHEREAARLAALQALLVTGLGGLAMLAGLLLLSQAAGTMELSMLLGQGDALQESPLYLPSLLLILVGAFTKSAQFPFHFWLPNAMEAPAPVSAYLHSATMVKAGVYLLARLSPALGGTEAWTWAVCATGAITMLAGGLLAVSQNDLKRLLAYSTISSLGMLVLLIGLGTQQAMRAMIVFLLAHALYKGALFLVAGCIDHETGVRETPGLGGLFRLMPLTGLAAGIATVSMAGFPPSLGFLAKELVYETGLGTGFLLTGAIVLAGVLSVFVAVSAGLGPFWGARIQTPRRPHDAPASMLMGPIVLATASLVIGVSPGLFGSQLVAPALSAVLGEGVSVQLILWHGVNLALGLSLATMAAGVGLFFFFRICRKRPRSHWTWGPEKAYAFSVEALLIIARKLTMLLQSGYLRVYLMTIVLATVGAAGFALVARGGWHWPSGSFEVQFHELALAGLILLAALLAITSRSRLGAVAALGVAGYAIALLYVLFGAPDLAMTQFLVESLTVVLFVLGFYHLPRFAQLSPVRAHVRDAIIALSAGALMTVLVLSAVGVQLYPAISDFFAERAWTEAHGRNIVNEILVDFRGLDTLGEVVVLSIAGIGVYALLKLRRKRDGSGP